VRDREPRAPAVEPTVDQTAALDSTGPMGPLDHTAVTLPVAPPGYELRAEVGAGGMGIVFRAREIAFDRDGAVKFLQNRYPVASSVARRFLDEARITGQLQPPAIPPVHRIGTLSDGRPFLVMKLIEGRTLADLLASDLSGNRGRFVAEFGRVCEAV